MGFSRFLLSAAIISAPVLRAIRALSRIYLYSAAVSARYLCSNNIIVSQNVFSYNKNIRLIAPSKSTLRPGLLVFTNISSLIL